MTEDTAVDSDRYLYGIVLTDSGLPSGADGVQAGQLHTVSSGKVVAAVSDLVETEILGADIASEILAPLEAEYTDALEKLSGHAQFTHQARYDRDTVLGEIIVKTMESWTPSEASTILEQLEPLAADMCEREAGQAEDVTEVAVLLSQNVIPKFNYVVNSLAEADQERLRFRLVGPQAPYSFASMSGHEAQPQESQENK